MSHRLSILAMLVLYLAGSHLNCLFAVDDSRIFYGKVIDSSGSALPSANVVAYSADGKLLSYSITDADGRYELRIGNLASHVIVSFIGMKSARIAVVELKQGQTVKLVEDEQKLRTVTVRAERIREAGDTLSYSVASFKEAQDRSIADVIKRMPGLEVKPNGAIEYQGKEISKFYIEGMNMMGERYSLASSNISANKVRDVQVLENHQKIKSLRGIAFEDRAALNIVLKDGAKSAWSVLLDTGAGKGEGALYENRVMGTQFSRQFQTLSLYKNNNTGADVKKELTEFNTFDSYREESGFLKMISIPAPDFDKQKYTFNHSHLIAGNWLSKTGEDSELSIQLDGLLDREDLRSSGSTTYLDVEGTPQVDESWKVRGKRNELGGRLNYVYNSDRTYIRSRTALSGKWNRSNGIWDVNERSADISIRPDSRMASEDFSLSHTTDKGNVWQLESSTGNTFLPSSMITISGQGQDLKTNMFSSKNSATFRLKSGRHYFSGKAGVNYGRQSLCDGAFTSILPYWEQGFQFMSSKHSISVTCRLAFMSQKYNSSSSERFAFDPTILWRWKPDGRNELTALCYWNVTPLSAKEMVARPVYTSYRNMVEGIGRPGVKNSNNILASWTYRDPLTGFFLNLRPAYARFSGNPLYESILENGAYSIKATGQFYHSDVLSTSFRIEESFPSVRMSVGIGGSVSSTKYSSVISGITQRFALDSYNASADFSCKLSSWFTSDGRSCLSASRRRCIHGDSPNTDYILDWAHKLNMNVFPVRGLRLSACCDVYHSSEKDYGVNCFFDLYAGYKRGKWELSLNVNNIVGTNEYHRVRVSSALRSYEVTYLRPRDILLKFSIEF